MRRKFYVFIGAMRSGKSYLANKLITQYTKSGGSALVYNLGRETDFESAELGTLLSYQEHLRSMPPPAQKQFKQDPSFLYYSQKWGHTEDFRKFSQKFKGRAMKCKPVDRRSFALFLDAYYLYVSNNLLVLDDFRSMTRHGLTEELCNLFSRINHTGANSLYPALRGRGSDVIAIFHSLEDSALDDIQTYATDIVYFKTQTKPTPQSIKNPFLRDAILSNWEKLYKMPNYSFLKIDIDAGTIKLVKS